MASEHNAVARPAGVPIGMAGGLPAVCLYPPNQHAYIYTLSDPRTGKVRYVGKTHNVQARYRDHLRIVGDKTHKEHWVNTLKQVGLVPEIDVIDMLPPDNQAAWEEAERKWILTFKAMGFPLTNLASGGRSGAKHSQESIERLRAAKLNQSPETRAKNSAAHVGMRHRPDVCERLSLIAKNRSPEHKRKLVEAATNISDETRAKMRAAALAMSDEKRKAISETVKRLWAEGCYARKQSTEAIAKSVATRLGRKNSPESIQRMRDAANKRWSDPEQRERFSKICLGRKPSPESIAKMVATQRANRIKRREVIA